MRRLEPQFYCMIEADSGRFVALAEVEPLIQFVSDIATGTRTQELDLYNRARKLYDGLSIPTIGPTPTVSLRLHPSELKPLLQAVMVGADTRDEVICMTLTRVWIRIDRLINDTKDL